MKIRYVLLVLAAAGLVTLGVKSGNLGSLEALSAFGDEPTMAPTAEPTLEPTEEPESVVTEIPCFLEKNGTWSEIENADQQRIEVGGGGVQHMDYYPLPGILAVSYVVPIQEPMIWWGFGSQWERPNGPQCTGYDMLVDAQNYAVGSAVAPVEGPVDQPGRLDNGHAGVVVDLTNGGKVYNLGSLTDEQVNELLVFHSQFQNLETSDSVPTSCDDAVREDHQPMIGQPWQPSDGSVFTIVNFWTNEKGQNQQEHKLLLSPGQSPRLFGGGAAWSWPTSCEVVVLEEFDKNPLPEVTLEQLRSMGLVA